MSDSISDILKKRGPSEPPEIEKIKKFVYDEIGQTPNVAMRNDNFFVHIEGSSAANTLRFKLFQLQRSLGHKHKIIIKIV